MKFTVKDVFNILGRHPVLTGKLQGRIKPGDRLLIRGGEETIIISVEKPNPQRDLVGIGVRLSIEAARTLIGENLTILPVFDETVNIITINSQEVFQIALASNPSSGFLWTLLSNGEANVLENGVHPPESSVAVGSPSKQFWNLSCERQGEFELVFQYARPWEDKEVIKIKMKIVVKNQ
jgi:predicted secreted protein